VDLSPIIPAGGTDDQNADEVPYDNSASGLAATDSQAAIDELASGGLVDTDDQALILAGDLLTIEDGAGSVDLSAYKDEDVTTKTGILLGDGTTISGLVGTADGQVAKWNAGTSTWEAGIDATGGGGSSLWTENGNDIENSNSGNIGIGTNSTGAKLQVQSNSTVDDPHIRIEEDENDYARLELTNTVSNSFWHVAGLASNTPSVAKLNFYFNNSGSGNNLMTITGDGNVGVGTTSPNTNFEVSGTGTVRHRITSDNSSAASLQWFLPGNAETDWSFTSTDKRMEWAYSSSDFSGGTIHTVLRDNGNMEVNGNIKTSNEIHTAATGAANMVPIAYGTIAANGNIGTGSGNFSVNKVGAGNYRIKIDGENYFWTSYTSQLTINDSNPGFINANSVGGNLVVRTYDVAGSGIDKGFTFVVFKP